MLALSLTHTQTYTYTHTHTNHFFNTKEFSKHITKLKSGPYNNLILVNYKSDFINLLIKTSQWLSITLKIKYRFLNMVYNIHHYFLSIFSNITSNDSFLICFRKLVYFQFPRHSIHFRFFAFTVSIFLYRSGFASLFDSHYNILFFLDLCLVWLH